MLHPFHAYDSISNKVGGPAPGSDDCTTLWVATHKIHGVNMSVTIHRDAAKVAYGRRTAYLKPDEKFHDFMDVLPHVAKWRNLLTSFPDTTACVTVYGELFGGSYPHPDVKVSKKAAAIKPVQRGVWYSPTRQFVAFDIRVEGEDGTGRYLDLPEAQAVFKAHGVPHVEVVFSGSYEDVVAWAREHRSAVVDPAWYQLGGLPLIEGNRGEGWVVRPMVERVSPHGDRLMYKIKNPDFNETAGPETGGGSSAGSSAGASAGAKGPTTTPATSAIVTAARVANVLTKELPDTLTFANFKALVALVVEDAVKDAGPDAEDPSLTAKTAAALVRRFLTA